MQVLEEYVSYLSNQNLHPRGLPTVKGFPVCNIMLPYPFNNARLFSLLFREKRWCRDFDVDVLQREVLT